MNAIPFAQSEAAELRRKLAVLMADGRWRTREDVTVRLGCTPRQASCALDGLARMNLITVEEWNSNGHKKRMYRRTA